MSSMYDSLKTPAINISSALEDCNSVKILLVGIHSK